MLERNLQRKPRRRGEITMNTRLTPVVRIENDTVYANSRDVAEFFGKEHFTSSGIFAPSWSIHLEASWFIETELPDRYGRSAATFDMTRDGFTLLVMGYTGGMQLSAAHRNAGCTLRQSDISLLRPQRGNRPDGPSHGRIKYVEEARSCHCFRSVLCACFRERSRWWV
jgi:Rha family phage regulatory protein